MAPRVGRECVDALERLVDEMRRADDSGQLELEARFGKRTATGFRAGVPREMMDAVIEAMESSPHVETDEAWDEHHDVFFTHKARKHRSRVRYDAATMQMRVETIVKEHVCDVDLVNEDPDGHDVRVSLKRETPIDPIQLPWATQPEHVRIKQQRRFVLSDKRDFAFDIYVSWSAPSLSQAEQLQKTSDAVYDIECELINRDLVLQKPARYVATSLAMKMLDLLPDDARLAPSVARWRVGGATARLSAPLENGDASETSTRP